MNIIFVSENVITIKLKFMESILSISIFWKPLKIWKKQKLPKVSYLAGKVL